MAVGVAVGVAEDEARPLIAVGIGWRRELAFSIGAMPVDFVEVVAEHVAPSRLPPSLSALVEKGMPAVPHGVSLSLAGADPPDPGRLRHLAGVAEALGSPLVSEHIAFVRADGIEAGHLLPAPRTRDALEVLVENVRIAQAELPVPLALENIATLLSWPDDELSEADFLVRLVDATGVRLLVDVANLHANQINHGLDPLQLIEAIPIEQVAYVHVAGGTMREGLWHDTHAHPVPARVLELLAAVRDRLPRPVGVLLERDAAFPSDAELLMELTDLRAVMSRAARM